THEFGYRPHKPHEVHLPVYDISHPVVDAVEDVLPELRSLVLLGEAHRLRDEVPRRHGIPETLQQPGSLTKTQHRARRVDARGAVARRRLVEPFAERDLGRAVLAGVG